MRQKVSLCTVCNVPAPLPTKKKGRKKSKDKWDSGDEDESDQPAYPAGIMKVRRVHMDYRYRYNRR